MPAGWRAYGRPLSQLPIYLALCLVVESLDEDARAWSIMTGHAAMWAGKDGPRPDPDRPIRATWRAIYRAGPVWPRAVGGGFGAGVDAPSWWTDDDDPAGWDAGEDFPDNL